MNIHIIAVGTRMPAWVDAGYREYARRVVAPFRLHLHEIPAGRRTKGADIARLIAAEGARQLSALPSGCRVIALDRDGAHLGTDELAVKLGKFADGAIDLALLVGGPEGLAPACLARADERWSLSRLTLAHPVVRVVLAEQLYRAWSILNKHPYHRS